MDNQQWQPQQQYGQPQAGQPQWGQQQPNYMPPQQQWGISRKLFTTTSWHLSYFHFYATRG